MEKAAVLKTIKREKLVPVIRTNDADDALRIVETLSKCGIKVFEITMTVPMATELIAALSATDSGVLVGAGTVLDEKPGGKMRGSRSEIYRQSGFRLGDGEILS